MNVAFFSREFSDYKPTNVGIVVKRKAGNFKSEGVQKERGSNRSSLVASLLPTTVYRNRLNFLINLFREVIETEFFFEQGGWLMCGCA